MTQTRNFGFDLLRAIACYMVLQVHAGEFYYIGAGGTVAEGGGTAVVGFLNSLLRTAVPLFVMLSGALLLPVRGTVGDFFSRRFVRVVVPFVVWCVLYALYRWVQGDADGMLTLRNIAHIPVNFGVEVGHLWYVYMLMGLYLFAPIISPWLETAARRVVEGYLVLWGVTLCLPYLHLLFPEMLGECYWNSTPMLYYFSGFLGYMVLAFYLCRYLAEPRRWHLWAGVLLVIAGYAVTVWGFETRIATSEFVSELELTWGFETINVAMMSLGLFLLLRGVRSLGAVSGLITDISKLSYGIYLIHIMVLNLVYRFVDPTGLGVGWKIPLIAVATFVVSYLLIKALSYLPGSKYLVG